MRFEDSVRFGHRTRFGRFVSGLTLGDRTRFGLIPLLPIPGWSIIPKSLGAGQDLVTGRGLVTERGFGGEDEVGEPHLHTRLSSG